MRDSQKSVACVGKAFGEESLRTLIFRKEPGVKQVADEAKFPLGVDWDFCGVRP